MNGFGNNVQKFEMGGDIGTIRSQALAIVSGKPDIVAFFMAPQDGALLVKEILNITSPSNRPHFVFDQSIQSGLSNYQKILAGSISKINGSMIAMSKNDFTQDFVRAFNEKYHKDPVFGSDMGYNSFMLLANTYDPNPGRWISNMKAVKLTGADGTLSFDVVGLRVPNIFFAELENGNVIK